MMDSDKREEYSEELVKTVQEILEIALEDPTFEVGIDEGMYDLVLSTQGDKVRLFEYVYFRDHAPESVRERWKVTIGRHSSPGFHLRAFDLDVSGDDVDVWVEKGKEDRISVSVHCGKVQDALEDENRVWWMLFTILDHTIGEIANMRHIDSFEVVDQPLEGSPVKLRDLPRALEDMGIILTNDADSFLQRYTVYKSEPDTESDGPWRFDILSGSDCCPPIINDYYSGERGCVDLLHADGAVAGYLAYPLDSFDGEDRSERIFDFRDSLEEALTDKAGADAVSFIGGATGLRYGYLDLIAWDLQSVIDAAQEFLTGSDVSKAYFRVFSMDVPTCLIANNRDGDVDLVLDGIDYIPYDPEDPEPFYDQISKWNDEDEYSRCIAVLETIPEEQMDTSTPAASPYWRPSRRNRWTTAPAMRWSVRCRTTPSSGTTTRAPPVTRRTGPWNTPWRSSNPSVARARTRPSGTCAWHTVTSTSADRRRRPYPMLRGGRSWTPRTRTRLG